MGTLTTTPTTLSSIMTASRSLEIVPTTTVSNKLGIPNFQYSPFIPDPSCLNSWTWNDIDFYASSSAISLKPTGVQASCMPDPDFWDGTFEFYPGVCPQDWTMYDIGRANVPQKGEALGDTRTTAYCCPQSYTLTDGAVLGMTLPTERACIANFPSGGLPALITVVKMPDRANSGPSTRTFEFGDVIQPAWHVIWGTSDQAALLPHPPTLGPGPNYKIATWTPPYVTPPPSVTPPLSSSFTSSRSGALSSGTNSHTGAAPTTAYEPSPKHCEIFCGVTPGIWFAMIGLPIIVFLLMVSCCVYACRKNRKAKRADALRRIEAADGAARGEPELVVIQPGTVRDVDNGFKGGKEEGELELMDYTKEAHEVSEAPPAYTPPTLAPAAKE